jgi:hypothetical protein
VQSRGSVHLFEDADRLSRTAVAGDDFGQEHAAFAREPLTESAAVSAFERRGVRALTFNEDGVGSATVPAWPFDLHRDANQIACRRRGLDRE